MKYSVIMIALCFLTACSDAPNAKQRLQAAGYSKIEITGTGFKGCPSTDITRTGFVAVSPKGSAVRGTVCNRIIYEEQR